MQRLKLVALVAAALGVQCASSHAVMIFQENFESTLSQWTGKSGGAHAGTIVADPFNTGNNVLSFTGLNYSGDIFTQSLIPVSGYSQVFIEFDYLGLAKGGSVADNYGGFFGITLNQNPVGGDASWIAGTDTSAANGLGFQGIHLVDDGAWHTYQIDITHAHR